MFYDLCTPPHKNGNVVGKAEILPPRYCHRHCHRHYHRDGDTCHVYTTHIYADIQSHHIYTHVYADIQSRHVNTTHVYADIQSHHNAINQLRPNKAYRLDEVVLVFRGGGLDADLAARDTGV